MKMTRVLFFSSFAGSLILALSGCGKNDPVVSENAPLQGRSVSSASKLLGTWMAVTDGDFLGIEFLKDDQVMVTMPHAGTRTMTFTVLPDGRLSLVGAQGVTQVYQTTLSGDMLELVSERPSGSSAQRFRLLPRGKSLAEGLKEQEQQMVEDMQKRILALRDQLKEGGVVIVPEDNAGSPWVLAVLFDNLDQTLNGQFILDESPTRVDPLRPLQVLPFQGETSAADNRSNRMRIILNARSSIEPVSQPGGQIQLTIDGPINKPVISGTANFQSIANGGSQKVVMKKDNRLHASQVGKLDDQRAAFAREKDRMAEFLGGRTTFTGSRTGLGSTTPDEVSLTVERSEQGHQYTAMVTVGNRQDQSAQGSIELLMGRSAFYLNMPWGEQWRLQTQGSNGAMIGPWRPNLRTDFVSYGNVELSLQKRWSLEEVAAEREAIRQFLTGDLRSPHRFTGYVERRYGATNVTRWPVSVELQVNTNSTVTGSVWMIAQNGGLELSGSLAGRSMTLRSGSISGDGADMQRWRDQRWQLEFIGLDPVPTFAGQMSAGVSGGGRIVLASAQPESYPEEKERLLTALTGGRFDLRRTDSSSDRDYSTTFIFKGPSATGQVTGEIVGSGSGMWKMVPPALLRGEIIDDHGMPVLKGTVTPAPDPASGGRDGTPFDIILSKVVIDDAVHLTGSTPPGVGNQDWFILNPLPGDGPVPPDSVRLAALKLGATTQVPTAPAVGDEILLIINVTERDQRVGQLFYADGKYTHRNSVPTAAIHAGLAVPGETCVVRLVYGPPFTAPVEAVAKNGVTSQRGTFRNNNVLPTYTIERIALD